MTARPELVDAGVEMRADPSRVVARLFLPGEGPTRGRSRTTDIADRVMSLPKATVREGARAIVSDFAARHGDLEDLLSRHAATIAFSGEQHAPVAMSREQRIVLGAAFTAEYALEGAALCNPTVVPHPDQGGLRSGGLRVAMGMRAIGEGHVSSIAFASAIIDADGWSFEPRGHPIARAAVTEGDWSREHFQEVLERERGLSELSSAVVRGLPDSFRSGDVEEAIRGLPTDLAQRRDPHGDLDTLRSMAWSAYRATFDESSDLTQRVLQPYAAEESHGMEDARFVRFDNGDGTSEYRGTYTAYDGRAIAPRLLVSPDLRDFRIHRLSGPAAVNKGMALFPRRVGHELLALTRTDGENLTMAASRDGVVWGEETLVHAPTRLWEVVQTGNCGSPIETDRGWLVLVHGVGPMRTYRIGALLLDLDDPRRVVAQLDEPLLRPDGPLRDGYVPNVVYTCGALAHQGTLWLPFGVGDNRIRVGSIALADLLDAMTPRSGRR